jgi:hypothetical protein
MDWKFWTPLAVNIVGVGFMWWQVRIMKQQIATLPSQRSTERIERERNLSRRLYFPVILMVILIVVSWIPYLLNKLIPPEAVLYILEHGTDTPFDPNNPLLGVTANGNLLLSYRDSYHVAAVGFHYYGNGNIKDAPNLQKSGLYDIQDGPIIVRIKPDEHFIQAANRGERNTSYALLLVPNNVQMDQFATLREAESVGVKIVQRASGPP